MKKALPLFLLLSLLLSLLLASCGGKGNETTPATSEKIMLDLSEYTIVYPYEPDTELFRRVRAFRDAIKEATGVNLPMKDDFVGLNESVPTDTKEILIGVTNRAESTSRRLGRDDTGIYFENNRLVISGGNAASTMAALSIFTETYLGEGALYYPSLPDIVRANYAYGSATLCGADIYDYVIVTDSKNLAVANYISNRIASATGAVLPVKLARDAAGVTRAIVVGDLSGDFAHPGTAAKGKWSLEVKGERIYAYGDTEDGAYSAADSLIERFDGTGETLAVTLPASSGGDVRNYALYSLNLPETFGDMTGKYDLVYSTESVMARFFATKDELPEEITVVEPIDEGRYALSRERQYYVSTKGSDDNPGTKEAPFATIQKAVDQMSGYTGGIIWVEGGFYSITKPINVALANGGSRQSPVFIKGYGEEEAVISSTKALDTAEDKWYPLDPSDNADVWDRIPEEARDKVIYTSLKDQGWTVDDVPSITKSNGPPMLYVGGEEYSLARYPNDTGATIDLMYFTFAYDSGTVTARDGSNLYWPWVERATKAGKDPATWIVGWEIRVLNTYDNTKDKNAHPEMGEEITSWVNTGDIWYYGSTFEGWEFGYYTLALETEGQYWAHTEDGEEWFPSSDSEPLLGYPKGMAPDGKTPYYSLKSVQNNSWGCKVSGNGATGRNAFYLFNAVEALDVPGEWFYDKESGNIYLYPQEKHEELSEQRVAFSNPTTFDLMKIGASYLVVDGLTFDGSSGYGIQADSATNVVVQNCTFLNTQNSNVMMRNCLNSALLYCDFSRAYAALVQVANAGSVNSLTPTNNLVQNCIFHDTMPLRQTGLSWGGCRMIVSHNYFNNTTTNGSSAVECIVEYNRFEGGSKDVTDGGMVYAGGSSARSNHFRYNLFHMFNATHQAVYNDTMGSGNYMYYNIVSTLNSRSDHNKPWYSSTGWGNVSYANITILRTPYQVQASGSNAADEGEVLYSKTDGDVYNESALFYYYFGDEYSAGGAAARYQPRDYDGVAQKDYSIGANGKVVFTSQPTLSQSLAGHWWFGYKTSDVTRTTKTYTQAAWWSRDPAFMNLMYGTKIVVDLYNDANEDYHGKYFYMPWYLTGKTYTSEVLPENVKIWIPAYRYLEKEGSDTVEVYVEAHLAEPNEDGSYTLTYEEVAAMERSRRAPQYSVVSNNVILGSTPIYESQAGGYVSTGIVDRTRVVTDTAGAGNYRGYIPTTDVINNFMHYMIDEIAPYAEYDFDYTISDESWDYIAAVALDDPALTVTAEALAALQKLDAEKTGVTYNFRYSDWFDKVYPDFD